MVTLVVIIGKIIILDVHSEKSMSSYDAELKCNQVLSGEKSFAVQNKKH